MNTKKWLMAICLFICMVTLVSCGGRMSLGDVDLPEKGQSPRLEPLASSIPVSEGFTVSHAFSSDMVLQRDEPIRVWGWADTSMNGETVTASFAGKTAEGKIEKGAWEVTFAEAFPANAARGNDMTVTCGDEVVVFEDVLVGDVYMVIGQSNVAYSVDTHCAFKQLNIANLVDSDAPIRLNYNTLNDTKGYPQRGTEEVCPDVLNGRGWWLPTTEHVRPFTALGYLFAREIVEKTEGNIPVGIIEIDGNGQPIGAFMPNEEAGATDSDSFRRGSGIYVPPGVNGTHGRYMYNHYMYPYERYAMAGVIWYQGESDFETDNANTYVNKFVALMERMRSTHNLNKKDFPVYVVELPTIYHKPADVSGAWHVLDFGYIRAEMGSIPQKLPNAYLAVSSDLFADDRYSNSLHPNIKDTQAERLADLAGSVWYGLDPLDEVTGPILKEYTISEDRKTATLTFDNVGTGLTTADGGSDIKGFCAINRIGNLITEVTLTATITAPDQVTVTADKSMYGVAYNCVLDNFYGKSVNLCNSNGQIAAAFTYSEMRMNQVRRELIGEHAQIVPLAPEDTLAVHFRTADDLVFVGMQIPKRIVEGGLLTLSLYAFDTDYETTIASAPLLSRTWMDFDRYMWAELSPGRNRTWKSGEYMLVISDTADVNLYMGDAHEGQVCYINGKYAASTSVKLGLTYAEQVDADYGIPTSPSVETESDTEDATESESLTESLAETEAETESMTETDSATVTETALVTETEAATETQTQTVTESATDRESETVATTESAALSAGESDGDETSGCSSVVGGVTCVIGLLILAGWALARKRQTRA